MKEYKSILLVRLRAVGEVVMTLPVLDIVRRNYPNAFLAMLVESPCEEIFEADSRADKVFVFNKPYLRSLPYHKKMKAFWEFVFSLRQQRFDLAVDLHNVSRSQWLTFLSGARERIGMRTRALTYHLHTTTMEALRDTRQHNIARYLQILRNMGMNVDEYTYEMKISPDALQWAGQWLTEQTRNRAVRVVLHPGAAHVHKCWPVEQFARFGDLLAERHQADIIITCGPGEMSLGEQVQKNMRAESRLVADVGLQQLAALLSKCDLLVSNDTGPTHISSVVGTPTIAVIGPTNPYVSGPATTCSRIVWAERYCSPCYRDMFTCPIRKCFMMIEPEQVLEIANKILQEGRPIQHESAVPGIHPRKDLPKRAYVASRV
ncbi:MAG TPA: glycosyltransferase family 9 protein [bacterium]|nr:glycosyltransferase family 9 protein [bacterium]